MKPLLLLALGLVVSCAVGPRTSAQTPAGLDIQVYTGLTITGAVGTVYSVEYVTDLAQTNNPDDWRCLEPPVAGHAVPVGRQVLPGDWKAVLSRGCDASPDEHDVHPAGAQDSTEGPQ
jgi:hypothetical protein